MAGLDVFPARAGVILDLLHPAMVQECFPRTRGGDPIVLEALRWAWEFSPHARG